MERRAAAIKAEKAEKAEKPESPESPEKLEKAGKKGILIPVRRPREELIHYVRMLLDAGFERVTVADWGDQPACGYIFGQLEEVQGCTVLHCKRNTIKGFISAIYFFLFSPFYDIIHWLIVKRWIKNGIGAERPGGKETCSIS